MAFFFFASSPAAGAESEIPPTIPNRRPELIPTWTSARAAVDASGRLRDDAASRVVTRALERRAQEIAPGATATTVPQCVGEIGFPVEQFGSAASVNDLVSNSRAILHAKVIATDEGFVYGIPMTLVALDVIERLKSADEVTAKRTYWAFPHARIRTSQGLICGGGRRGAPIPKPGDEVILFSFLPEWSDGTPLQLYPHLQMILSNADGIWLPEGFRTSSGGMADVRQMLSALKENPAISVIPRRPDAW